jgi:hypothetical protein
MKFFAVMLLLTGASNSVYCQLSSSQNFSSSRIESPLIRVPSDDFPYKVAMPPGLRMRNTGRTLTIIGGAMLVGGIALLASADEPYYSAYSTPYGTHEEGDPKAAVGILMMLGGTGMAVPGIIFWSKGSKKYKRYLEREAALHFERGGVSVALRF